MRFAPSGRLSTLCRLLCFAALTTLLFGVTPGAVQAGFVGGVGGQGGAVGGVMIDPDGRVRAATPQEQQELATLLRQSVGAPDGDLTKATDRRVISLSKLQAELQRIERDGGEVTPEIAFLSGLQRIEHVVVDKANNDLLIVGPAEPWTTGKNGAVVGESSGRSVVRLDDLVTAFRSVETARNAGGIRCSIEPTDEGRRRLQNLLSRVKLRPGQNPTFLEAAMREAFGPQQILLSGVPSDSRFARTMVAADFEMKRIAMALVDSPVPQLPSYLELARNKAHSNSQNPRWWMACNYEPIRREASGRVWKISGQGVKTLTEQDIIAADGSAKSDGGQDKLAVRWAETMTEQFESLSKEMPVFQDLRNAMDLAVVATLIRQEQLDVASGIDLAVLRGEGDVVPQMSFRMPKSLEPQCSFVRGRAGWTVTASGGVNVNAFAVAENQVQDSDLATLETGPRSSDRWWWNAP